MRKLAARRLPGSIFDYIEGGGEDEVSLRRNRSSFDDWSFLPKWGSVDNLDLSSTLLGGPVSMPLTLVPDRRDQAVPPGRRDAPSPGRRSMPASRTVWRT